MYLTSCDTLIQESFLEGFQLPVWYFVPLPVIQHGSLYLAGLSSSLNYELTEYKSSAWFYHIVKHSINLGWMGGWVGG